ncbi:MAG: glycosyltransferase [Planctomycetes bacterium]|nr:glycosyltransferase [Planctomycetota bacterium]
MKASIVIPTWNGEREIGECLEAVFSQRVDFPFDVLLIDSSSSDGTLAVARRFPVRVHVIPQADFDHGDTRNLGALLTDGEYIVFLVQDARPLRRDWLARLVGNLADPRVAGAFSRVLPRPGASPLVVRGVQGDLNFGAERLERAIEERAAYDALDPLARRIFVNFNDVASCVRRAVWQKLPFPRTPFGEDVLWAKAALEAGHRIVFDPEAPVIHSHEYDAATLRQRTRIDGWLNRAYLDRVCVVRRRDVFTMTRRAARADREHLRAGGARGRRFLAFSLRSYAYHYLEFQGAWEGGRTRDRLRAPVLVPEERLKVLLVAHAFPPESSAGTENVTLALARALAASGHEVVVCHRSADPALSEHAVAEGEHAGLRVLRIGNRLAYGSMRQTFHNRPVEDAFRAVLERERPHVVHFQHLIHLSVALPRICRQQGIPSILTLNDFWFRCPRVQLMRPDRRICSGAPPFLGCAACLANLPSLVAPLRFVSRPLRRPLASLARRFLAAAGAPRTWLGQNLRDAAWLALRPGTVAAELLAADFIFAPSRFLKAKMVEAGVPAERLIVSDYGLETAWLEGFRRAPAPGRVRFGFVGSLVWYKGLEVLARAFQRIPEEAAELHIHGDSEGLEEFRETRRRVEALVTRPGLFFHGRYAPGDLGQVLGAIDVLVVPSLWYENSPLAVHEAFQAGIPVLVSDQGGMRDLVAEGAGGLRFRPGDDRDLARVMRRFLAEPELAARVGGAAPRVKTAAEAAAEMEVKYRQALGLARGRGRLLALPAAEHVRARGAVEEDGDAIVLLPRGDGPSSVEFDVDLGAAAAVELSLAVLHGAGEEGVEQGGEVLLDGKGVLRLEPTAGCAGGESTSEFVAPLRLRAGRRRLLVSNALPGEGRYLLRFREVVFYRTSARLH